MNDPAPEAGPDAGLGAAQPLIAVDVVPLSFLAGRLRVGTVTRAFEPFAGREALPGVLLGAGELIRDAATRALASKGGAHAGALIPVGTFDRPGRDPRSHAISIAWLAPLAPADIRDDGRLHWGDPRELDVLPFDHAEIVGAAIAEARHHLWSDAQFTRTLTGEEFTGRDAVALEHALTGETPHAGNLQRTLGGIPGLERSGSDSGGHRGRPAVVWRWG